MSDQSRRRSFLVSPSDQVQREVYKNFTDHGPSCLAKLCIKNRKNIYFFHFCHFFHYGDLIFFQISHALCLLKTLRLYFLPNFQGPTFISYPSGVLSSRSINSFVGSFLQFSNLFSLNFVLFYFSLLEQK